MRRLRLALSLLAIPFVLVVIANVIVLLDARGESTEAVSKVPHEQAALVLGAEVDKNGKPSAMLADRIAAAADLYKAKRVEKILLSGDHSRWDYDEVGTMRKVLLSRGIPAADIFTDHAGFDTWDSAQRARRVFGVHSVVIVTQRFHMSRALYAAHRAGLRATGYVADRRSYKLVMQKLQIREVFARVKAVGDAVTGADPTFLGPSIPIEGDGRASWGPAGPRSASVKP